MKIAYITVKIPYSTGETFIVPEIREVMRQGNEVVVLPFRPGDKIFHEDARALQKVTHRMGLFAPAVFMALLSGFLKDPAKSLKIIAKMIFGGRSFMIKLKNLTAIPKGFYTANILIKEKAEHIHVHWGSTPATAGYIASYLTGIPWSFTSHRWDIKENNLLEEKISSAAFMRVISEDGKKDVIRILNNAELSKKIFKIYTGVYIPISKNVSAYKNTVFTMICPANLVPVKGHRYLIESLKLLIEKKADFKCIIAGEGPLGKALKAMVLRSGLESRVSFVGELSHVTLLEMYEKGVIDLVVLPSITTESGDKEGIPVALIEAMAFSVPVIATATGGIPELLSGGSGIIIKEKSPQELSDAIFKIYRDKEYAAKIASAGRKKIETEFSVIETTKSLLNIMSKYAKRYIS
ncbi:MAG: glycosyltransferase family 4 protein [Candidatus Omnitrophica bacterium]|nr:glycosyltransferase family 4 protein [Candidatus Omnitrophota bacterium]